MNKNVLLVYPGKHSSGTISDIPLSLLYLSGSIRGQRTFQNAACAGEQKDCNNDYN
jgi:hypothetical protein